MRPSTNFSNLAECGTDMTRLAKMGKLDPVIRREKEIEQLTRALLKRRKCNACLVGDAGVGKTAAVEGLAIKVAQGSAPTLLQGKKVISLEISPLVAGACYWGMFEGRLQKVLDEIKESNGSIILFIDELLPSCGIVPAKITTPQTFSNRLIARGEFMVCSASALRLDEYTERIEKDAALKRRFQKIQTCEPSRDESIAILNGIVHKYEAHHRVNYSQPAIVASVDLSKRYIRY